MFHQPMPLTRTVATIACCILTVLSVIGVFAVVTKPIVGLPIVLLVLLGWGTLFLLQVVLPIIAVIQVLAWLNRKLFAQAQEGCP